jgi:hypothetical protein
LLMEVFLDFRENNIRIVMNVPIWKFFFSFLFCSFFVRSEIANWFKYLALIFSFRLAKERDQARMLSLGCHSLARAGGLRIPTCCSGTIKVTDAGT